MYDEPDQEPNERAQKPEDRAREKADEMRVYAQLAAVFEGPRKFFAELRPGLDPELARGIQRTVATIEKAKAPDSPILVGQPAIDAGLLLDYPKIHTLATGDYHIHRRPGELMIVRFLQGEEVETYYERLQAHFDAGFGGFRQDERANLEWKRDPKTEAYLSALDAIDVKMADWYLRDVIRKHGLFVLSTQTADEMNIAYIADHVMGVPAAELVGGASAPPDEPTERDLAWFFKLFALRGMAEGQERMCFFTYMQKSDDGEW